MRQRVLVVEDERDLADLLAFNLSSAGYQASAVYDGRAALEAVQSNPPDLLILDVMLPEYSGLEVAKRLRDDPEHEHLPILMLTAKASDDDQVAGLSSGADDYITKPFSVKVLLARTEALLRRSRQQATGAERVLRFGAVEVDLQTHEARVNDTPVRLTLTEFRLLASLLRANGRVLSRSSLIAEAIGPGITVTERTVDVHIAAVRRKLGEHGSIVKTVRGVGYRLVSAAEGVSAG